MSSAKDTHIGHLAYLGCDPGAKGAICMLYPEHKLARFYPTPGGKDPLGFLSWAYISRSAFYMAKRAAIEDVHSLYGMSAKSNFNFGFNVGAAHALLEAALWAGDVKLEKVQPKVWQKAVGINARGKKIKTTVAELARKLYPECDIYGPKGGLMDGRADALMIAHYLYLQDLGG
jgi:hypothetical protein